MKLGRVLIYVIILVFIAGYVYLVEIKQKETKEAEEKKAKQIVQLDKDKVVDIQLQSKDKERIELKKPADAWVLTEPIKGRGDDAQIGRLLKAAEEATPEKTILDKDVNWKDYGLDKPDFTITLSTAEKTHTLAFGAQNPAKTSYYLRADEDPRLFLVADTLKNAFNKTVFDLRDKVVVNVAPELVNRIVITRKGAESELQRKDGNKWEMVKPDQFRVKASIVDQGLMALTNINAKEIIDEPKKEDDPYGLDNPEEKIVIAGKDQEHTLLVGKREEKGETKAPSSNRYVRMKGHDTVFVVDGKALDNVKSDPDQLRDKSLFAFKPLDVDKVEVTLDGKKWLAVQDKERKWSLEEPEKRPTIESWPITGMLWDLKDLEWKSMTKPLPDNLASVHLDKPELIVTVHVKEQKEPLVMKAGWEPVIAQSPSATPSKESAEGDKAKNEPAEKAASPVKGAQAESAMPKAALPPTINATVEPHEDGQALLVLDSGIVTRLRGDLEKLLEKKEKK